MALTKAFSYWSSATNEAATDARLVAHRPFSFIGPLLFTLPVIYLFGRQWVKRPAQVVVPTRRSAGELSRPRSISYSGGISRISRRLVLVVVVGVSEGR